MSDGYPPTESHPSPPPPGEAAALVERFRSGDENALGRLLELHWPWLVRYAVGILGDEDGAEDIVQEAYVQLWTHRDRWSRRETLRPVLVRIVRNGALNEKRRRSVFRRWVRRFRRPERDTAPGPAQAAEGSELRRVVHEAVEALPERRREIFLLVRFQQLTYREAAEALDISPQRVATQVSQAMKDLRGILKPYLTNGKPPRIPVSSEADRAI